MKVKKRMAAILSGLGVVFTLGMPTLTRADDNVDPNDASEKARKAHDLAGSDVIYQQEDFKALYYQNVEMIQLLKEIRDCLGVIKAHGIKNTEEKNI